MKKIITLFCFLFFTFSFSIVRAQVTVSRHNPYNNIQFLVHNILLGQGVLASNIVFSGDDTAFGFFNGVNSNIGLDSGIVLTNGSAADAAGPNNNPSISFSWPNCTTYTDPDLAAICGSPTTSVAKIDFDFIPTADTIKFKYVFGSEEIPVFVGSFNDAFGFFLSGPNINGPYLNNAENIALLPNSTTPVTINNVNCATNVAYFHCNYVSNRSHPCGAGCPTAAANTTCQYNGLTVPLTAIGVVQCGLTYHIKIAICNASDCSLESGVFLEAGSFTSTGPKVSTGVTYGNTYIANDNVIYRNGCGTANIVISRPDSLTPDTVVIDTSGTATPNVDYTPLPDTVILPVNITKDTMHVTALGTGSGTKTINVKLIQNICGQRDTQQVSLLIESTLPISINEPPVLACYNNYAALNPVISGGVAGTYKYTWSNGSTTAWDTAQHIISDTVFVIKVKDFCGDSASDSIHVRIPAPLQLAISRDTLLTCPHDTVVVGVTVSGGAGTYTYVWNNSATSTSSSQQVVSLITTKYKATVTDSCGAVANDSMTVTINSPPLVTTTRDTSINCSGTVTPTVYASGGGGNYVYSWSNGATTSSISVFAVKDTNLIVSVTSPCGNLVNKDTVRVTVIPPSWALVLSGITTICNGQSTTLGVTGGGNTYLWTPGNNTNSTVTVSPGATQTYSLKVSSGNCFIDTTVVVTVNPTPTVAIVPLTQTLCQGDTISLTASGATSYTWSGGQTTAAINVAPNTTTVYKVVGSSAGCTDTVTANITVKPVNINLCCDTTIYLGGAATLLVTKGAASYLWTPSTWLSCNNCPTPIASPTVTTTYTVTAEDTNGCVVQRYVTVTVEAPCSDFKIPTVFTPNNDGINDDFVINILNPTAYNITIYDRWGKQVYTSSNPTEYWNGRINGTENLVPDGTYYYVINAGCGSNNYSKKGFVEVIGEK